MKKHTLILFYLFCSVALLTAQDGELPFHLRWGEELKEPKSTFLSKIITSNADHFFALREKQSKVPGEGPSKIFIEKYNKQMKLLKTKTIDMKYKGKKMEMEDVLVLNRELYLLSSFNNIGKRKNYLFAQKINPKTLTPSNKLLKIGEVNTKNKFQEGAFGFHISKDSSKILVYNEPADFKNESERFTLSVFDNQFQPIWNKQIVLPYPDKSFFVKEYQVDKSGNIYMLAIVFKDGNRFRKKGKPNYHYSVLAYKDKGETMEEYPISLDDKFITDLTFRIGNDGKLVCSGFYSDKGMESIRGSYFFRLDPETRALSDKNAKDFDFKFLTANVSDRRAAKMMEAERKGKKKKQAELDQYSLDHLILRNDGGALLVAEQHYVTQQTFNDSFDPFFYNGPFLNNRNQQTDFLYHYNDIIVVNIRPNGEIQWTARIPKSQVTQNNQGYFSSYAMSIVRDKIYFIYNDNRKNFEPESDRIYNFNPRNSVVAVSQLNTRGEIKTFPVLGVKGGNVLTRPKVCRQTGRKEMVIYGENGKRFKFANLQFL